MASRNKLQIVSTSFSVIVILLPLGQSEIEISGRFREVHRSGRKREYDVWRDDRGGLSRESIPEKVQDRPESVVH